MPKGKSWSMAEEHELMELRASGDSVALIAAKLKKSPDAVKQKLRRLGFKVVPLEKSMGSTTTSELILPKELPSIEEALKMMCAAQKALEQPGLSKTEILRLRTIISSTKIYNELLAKYLDYRRLEKWLFELEQKYHDLCLRQEGKPVSGSPSSEVKH